MARADTWGTKGYGKGKAGDYFGSRAHEDVSRTLVRILRYESSKYALEGPDGWVSLEELLQKCKGQIKISPAEVLQVALDSEGSQGKRFEVDPTRRWLRARYKHGGKTGKGKGRGVGAHGADGNFRTGEQVTGGGWESYSGASAPRQSWQNPSGQDPWQNGGDPWQKGTQRWREDTSNAAWGSSPSAPSAPSAPSTSERTQETKQETQQPQMPHSAAHSAAPSAPPAPSRPDPEATETKWKDPQRSKAEGVESFDISTPRQKGEAWQKFIDPQTGRIWLYHADTEEFFFEHTARAKGWTLYASELGAWWHHDRTERWFFDPKAAES